MCIVNIYLYHISLHVQVQTIRNDLDNALRDRHAMVERLKSELEEIRNGPDDILDREIRRVTADRDILALNLSSAVNQAMSMMGERDAAVLASSASEEAAAKALRQQHELQKKVSTSCNAQKVSAMDISMMI